jgi:hypothetical protein
MTMRPRGFVDWRPRKKNLDRLKNVADDPEVEID